MRGPAVIAWAAILPSVQREPPRTNRIGVLDEVNGTFRYGIGTVAADCDRSPASRTEVLLRSNGIRGRLGTICCSHRAPIMRRFPGGTADRHFCRAAARKAVQGRCSRSLHGVPWGGGENREMRFSPWLLDYITRQDGPVVLGECRWMVRREVAAEASTAERGCIFQCRQKNPLWLYRR
jgi:ribosomal protein L34E